MIAAATLLLVVSGCGKSNPSNPLIGKWKLAQQSLHCPGWDQANGDLPETIEFTEKTMTLTESGRAPFTDSVTYDRDGDFYLVKEEILGTAVADRFRTESGGIETGGCHYVADN
jgi:hypothetical protein